MREKETSKNRIKCSVCTPCQTEDKENENLSLYDKINPSLTTCGTCKECVGYT
jgi:hypothetical protein